MIQVYLPMYLTYTLNLKFSYTAMVPLASLLSGFIGTIIVTQFNKFLSQQVNSHFINFQIFFWLTIWQIIYLMGCLVTVSASIWIIYADTTNNFFWGVAVLLGMGGSIMLVMALSMISKLIGDNTVSRKISNFKSSNISLLSVDYWFCLWNYEFTR